MNHLNNANIDDFDSIPLDTVPPEKDDRDWIAEAILPSSIKLPRKLDLSKDMRPVRNQKTQGSCVGFAVSCMKEWQEKRDINFSNYFSPQWIYNHRTNDGTGMHMREAMQILQKVGIVEESRFSYGSNTVRGEWPEGLEKNAANYQITSYAQVNTLEGLKKALNQNGPCPISVPVYNRGQHMWIASEHDEKPLGWHAMTVVGYDDAKKDLKIRNSWGVLWNLGGYAYMPYEHWGLHSQCFTTIDKRSYIIPDDQQRKYYCCYI